MKASDLMVSALQAEGVEYIFGIPGEENLDFLEALRGSSIRLVLTRHEQAAGFMAATHGRLTGRTGVCLATLGPGATNLVTAAAYAKLGAMPMLMITGQKPIKTSKQGQFQIVDVVDTMRPLTKFARQITASSNIPTLVREAFRIAEDERPGAVHLELPEDIAREETDAPLIGRSEHALPVASERSLQRAVEMIESATSPLLMVGAGANRKHTCRALTAFTEATGIPFFTTQMGKGVIDERSPQCIGTAALSDNDDVHRAIDASDLIINVGHDVVEKPPFFMRPGQLEVIHINYITASVDAVYYPQLGVIGDVADSVRRLADQVTPQARWEFSTAVAVKARLQEQRLAGAHEPGFPLLPQRLVAEIRAAMPSDGIVTLDNGLYKIWFARNYPAYQPNTVLLDNALATMGAGLPSAIAARLIHPRRRVVAVCGDGGLMMNAQELETAVRLGLDLVVVVLTDQAYGMIKWKQANMGFADFGLDYDNPDFVQYANSYRARGHRVSASEDLGPMLETCLNTPGVDLIEVPIDYHDTERWLRLDA